MKHVFKLGGEWEYTDGTKYTIKVVNSDDFDDYLKDGWFASLDEAKASKKPRRAKASE